MRQKLALAHLPTPLWRSDALDALVGASVWVKRDDMSAGAEAGNKIRKLEYLLFDALQQRASTVVTCGGVQSNHARATALLAAQVGLGSVLCLRTADPSKAQARVGNLLLDQLAGADIRFIDADAYRRRREVMAEVASELTAAGHVPYVIPEGGSNGLGALGYVDAMREVREQLDLGLAGSVARFDAVVHACGSGGTAAGVALGVSRYDLADRVLAVAVCDDVAYFEAAIGAIVLEASAIRPELASAAPIVVHDRDKGPGYGVASDEQKRFIADVARQTGLVLDPVYSGKALFALSRLDDKPDKVLFIHTGGLPGLLAQADQFSVSP